MIKQIDIDKVEREISVGLEYDFGEGKELITDVIDLPQRIWIKTECRNLHFKSDGSLIESVPAKVFKILIAEDDSDTLSTLADLISLHSNNYFTYTASDGIAALKLYRDRHVDLIVTDYKMPIQDGDWFIKEVRKINQTIPISLITGYIELLKSTEFYEDPNLYIHQKPIDHDKLCELIDKIFKVN